MVKNRWSDEEAGKLKGVLEERVYSSRLLGQDAELVMHGGGNTSVKAEVPDVFGQPVSVLYVKGSGWDLGTIEPAGFPALRMERLHSLRKLSALGDTVMMNELRTSLIDSKSPDPSVESLLHAFLPHRFIDHTHADAILTLSNQPDGEAKLRSIFGDRVAYVPYVMPGFLLAKACAEAFERNPAVEGLILLKHGIFSFGDTAKESYDRMIRLVNEAESFISEEVGESSSAFGVRNEQWKAFWMSAIREECARRKYPCVLRLDDSRETLSFVNHPNAESFSQRGPLTPDHVIRTKRLPLYLSSRTVQERSREELTRAFDKYAEAYDAYFARNAGRVGSLTKLDPLPRVFLLPGVGVISAGTTAKDAGIVYDIYKHTAACILNAEQMGGYEALPEEDIFDVEYWVLEQAKLKLGSSKLPLTSRVAVITGGVSGIGLSIAEEFLSAGGQVFVMDINTAGVSEATSVLNRARKGGSSFQFLTVDVSDRTQVAQAITKVVETAGGIDALVLNAGIFPPSNPIESISLEDWNRSMRVNLDGPFHILAESLKWMKSRGGDIIFVASKNAPAPGKGAGAYSVAKAAQTQLARVCALEAAQYGIRVNVLHPHLILDTKLWNDDVLASRAKAYGMTVDEYRTNNLLRTGLESRDVAKATLALVSGAFSKSTGLQIPIDGGSDRTL